MSIYIWGHRADTTTATADKVAADAGTLSGVDTSACTTWTLGDRLLIQAPDAATLAELDVAISDAMVGDYHKAWRAPYPAEIDEIKGV